MKKIDEYELIIWDLDGTLYFQKEFRWKMGKVLLKELILKPWKWKELLLIYFYRKLREEWDSSDTGEDLDSRQYQRVGKKVGMDEERARQIITYWMQKKPLQYLKDFRDERAASIIQQLQKKEKKVVVYSDYPTIDKLNALKIKVEKSFSSSDKEISCLKPNPKGINYIISYYGVSKENVLMIGDREEKDGEAAKNAGIDRIILERDRTKRDKQYREEVIS